MDKNKKNFFHSPIGQIVYGISLIIIVIALIAYNTIFVLDKAKNSLDVSVNQEALYMTRMFAANAYEDIDNVDRLQTRLNRIKESNPYLLAMDVLLRDGEQFKVIASFEEEKIDTSSDDLNYIIAWSVNESMTTYWPDKREGQKGNKIWQIATPILDDQGEKVGLVMLQLSTEIIDDFEKDLYTGSFIILVVTLLVISILLSLNFRLFQYAQLFRKLKEVDQMKDEFISIASHELRTPITTIKGFLSMMLEGDFGELGEEGKKTLKIMEASVKRLASLVEDLLNVSRIEQSRLKITPIRIKTKEVLESIGDEFKLRASEKNLDLRLQVPNDLPDTYADEDKLRQVLVNLVGNSVKYTKKGEVEIIAKQSDNRFVTITIKDTGIGMSAKDREQLFSKFYRIQGEETKGIVGTGLGLWITKQLVELMGGEIFVDSIKHVGSQFYFTVPIYGGQDAKQIKKTENNKDKEKSSK